MNHEHSTSSVVTETARGPTAVGDVPARLLQLTRYTVAVMCMISVLRPQSHSDGSHAHETAPSMSCTCMYSLRLAPQCPAFHYS